MLIPFFKVKARYKKTDMVLLPAFFVLRNRNAAEKSLRRVTFSLFLPTWLRESEGGSRQAAFRPVGVTTGLYPLPNW
jgi:hypothetical protein